MNKDKKIIRINAIAFMIIFVGILLDQLTKMWISEGLIFAEIIPGVLNFRFVKNTGAAFGILGQGTLVLTIISAVLVVVMAIVFWKYRKNESKLFKFSLALIIAGAAGNLIDRMMLGYVVDFIEMAFVDFAIFNVADVCITIGTILFAVFIIFFMDKDKRKKDETRKNLDTEDMNDTDSVEYDEE